MNRRELLQSAIAAIRAKATIEAIEPDPLCLVVNVRTPRLSVEQVTQIKNYIVGEFTKCGAKVPPILILDEQFTIQAVPKSSWNQAEPTTDPPDEKFADE
jgi:hypothetical protein